ncbi:PAS domain S-box protein [Pontibacter harenae]|uniref:PAS domain S-box protein n=1 Tax=Pontibacter harenae TaxID=2894083 RepID=UPI001E322132|nr:PAS domain S-box protein [Pontibacter harenae]MCC9167540.1 PAS domain S-box protein [Pontibacter harenae]
MKNGSWNNGLISHLLNHSDDVICTLSSKGKFIKVGESCSKLLGYPKEELEGRLAEEFIYQEDRVKTTLAFQEASPQKPKVNVENRFVCSDGRLVRLSWSSVWSDENNYFLCIGHNDAKQAETDANIEEEREVHRLLKEYGADLVALIDENGNCIYEAGAFVSKSESKANPLKGNNIFDFIYPEDTATVKEAFFQVKQTNKPVKVPYFRFKNAHDQWRWIEANVSNQQENPLVKGIFICCRDVTQSRLERIQLEESEQRFKSLFENNPDMVLWQNESGAILDANNAFLSFIKKEKEEVIDNLLADYLPKEVESIFNQKLREAFSGNKVSFEVDVNFEEHGQRVLSVVKVPLIAEGKVVSVHAVIKDVTETANSYRIVEQQATKLHAILESITDAFYTLDKDWKFTFINSEFERLVRIDKHELLGKSIWSAFPENVTLKFNSFFHEAVEAGKTMSFELYVDEIKKWLEARVYPSEEGLSVYLHDKTVEVYIKEELEKLSLIASKTSSGAMITDAGGRVEWINEGFTKITGYTLAETVGKKPGALLQGAETDQEEVQRIREKLREGVPFNALLLNYKKTGEAFWVSMDISPVYNASGVLTHFIAIQKDITPRIDADAKLVKMSQDLYQHNTDMQQFTYIISHNLRGAVANALGLSRLLSNFDKASAQYDVALSYLNDSIARLDDMLLDINRVLSIRDKRDMLEKESVRLLDVYQQAIGDMQEALDQCNGQVFAALEEGLLVDGYRAYLHSIFYNLLSNAIKYRSQERNLIVKVEAAIEEEGKVVIRFSDNGSGFDMEKAGRNIFKLYKRFHSNIEGKGVGLFLMKAHIEAMGGSIEVDSRVGVGTSFTIKLNGKKA